MFVWRQQYHFTVTYIILAKIAYNSYFPHILIHSWVFKISFLHCFIKALKNKITAYIPVQKGKCFFSSKFPLIKLFLQYDKLCIWYTLSKKQRLKASCLLLAFLNKTHFLLLSKVHTGCNSLLQILCCQPKLLQNDALRNICMIPKYRSRKTRFSHCVGTESQNKLTLVVYKILQLWQILIWETEQQVLLGTKRRQGRIRKYNHTAAVMDGECLNAKNCLHV